MHSSQDGHGNVSVTSRPGSFKSGATTFPLTTGAATDLTGLLVGITDDLRLREVAL